MSKDLVIERVSKRYGKHQALDDVSLTVEQGQFLTLLGPSGSGKTTLLLMIAGFVEPDAGVISLGGRVLNQILPERRNFGIVFQGYALFPHLSVADNVGFSMAVRRHPRTEIAAKVRSALDMVQLGHLADRLPRQLSGGQQQRVALARALAFSPELILLDEPLSALDKKLRTDLQKELRALHDRLGVTFVCVTHDQDEALSMSDRVAILRDGTLVQTGSPADLYHKPQSRFAASFLGSSNFIDATVVSAGADGIKYRYSDSAIFLQTEGCSASGRTPIAGDKITISLRPEKIILSSARNDGVANSVRAHVTDVGFNGARLDVSVQPDGLPELQTTMTTWQPSVDASVGAELWVSWDASASQRVTDE
ncbi:ABC transporter ATP-binding protein [Bradyrhizobium sp. AZCC 2230]|uniref:ABC transporter ATP-binding protein n=1 Tax=Bradyrhizobium sp. AZCC 2230 TaxID=3117021 RepID=UPI002FF14E39